jgi:hypothetical protein
METDRKQIEMLLYFIAPAVMLWTGFGASFCYELGKNGMGNVNWAWIVQINIPIVIISISLFYSGYRKIKNS